MKQKLGPWLRRGLLTVAALYALYLVVGNALLLSGGLERLLRRRPVKFQMGWDSAWSVIPGRVQVNGFWMMGQTLRSQWMVTADGGSVHMGLLPLFTKRFDAQRIVVSGVDFRFRRQRIPGEPVPPDAALEPEIPGMPEERPPVAELAPRPRRRWPWRLQFAEIEIRELRQLWLAAYRIEGPGQASGSLNYTMSGPLEIGLGRIELPAAQVFSGQRQVGEDLEAELELAMAPSRVSGRRLVELLPEMEGRAELAGEVADFGFLNLYFTRLPSLALHGAGELEAAVELSGGELRQGSALSFSSPRIGVNLRDYEVAGRGVVQMTAVAGQRVVMEAVVDEIDLAGGGVKVMPSATEIGRGESAGRGEPCRVILNSSSSLASFTEPFTDPQVSLRLPRCQLSDLTSINDALPAKLPLRFLPASDAVLEAGLDLSEDAGEGELVLEGHRLGAQLAEMPLVGDLHLELTLIGAEAEDLLFDLSGSSLMLENVSYAGSELTGEKWWATARVDEAYLDLARPMAVDAELSVEMADTLLFVAAFAPASRAQLLARLLDLERPRAQASVWADRERFEISGLRLEGTGLGRRLLGGQGAEVVLESQRLDVERGFGGLDLNLRLPPTEIPDLAVFNEFLPIDSGLRFETGSRGLVHADLSVSEGDLAGRARLHAPGTALWFRELPLEADLLLQLELPRGALGEGWLELSGSELRLERLSYGRDPSRHRGDWSARVLVTNGGVLVADEVRLTAGFEAALADTRPMLEAFAPRGRSGLRLEDLFNIESVRARGELVATRRHLQLADLEISGRGTGGGHLEGPGFQLEASSVGLEVNAGFSELELGLALPPSRLVDLAAFNEFIPDNVGIAFSDGSDGEVWASLQLAEGGAQGQGQLVARGVGVQLGDVSLMGDVRVDLNLQGADLNAQRFELGDTTIRIEEAGAAEQAAQERWWARVDFPRAAVVLSRPLSLDTLMHFEMGDSRPLVSLVTDPESSAWLGDLLSFNQVIGSAELAANEEELVLRSLELRGLGRTSQGIVGPGLKISATGKDVHLEEGLEGLELRVDLPESELRDLSLFNPYFPADSGLELLPGGRGKISAWLELGAGRGRGRLAIAGPEFGLRVGETTLRGGVELEVQLASGDLQHPVFDVAGSRLRLSDVRIEGSDGRVREGWFAEMLLASGTARVAYPLRLESRVELMLSDTWPLVAWGQELSRTVRLFRRALLVDNVAGRSLVRLDSDGVSFEEIDLEGDDFAVEGRYRLLAEGDEGLLFVRLGRLSAAMRSAGEERRFKLFRARRWYDHQLASATVAPPLQ